MTKPTQDNDLHGTGDALSVAENLVEVLCPQDRPQGCLSQQSGQKDKGEENVLDKKMQLRC